MTQVTINRNSLGQQYVFTVKEPGTNRIVDINNFDAGIIAFILKNDTVITTSSLSFGDKTLGQVIYTTDPTDFTGVSASIDHIKAQIRITGPLPETDISKIFDIILVKDFTI